MSLESDLKAHLEINAPSFLSYEYTKSADTFDDPGSNAPALYFEVDIGESEENTLMNGISQKTYLTIEFTLITSVASYFDLCDELSAAMLGYVPTGMIDGCVRIDSEKINTKSNYKYSSVYYQTNYYLRKV